MQFTPLLIFAISINITALIFYLTDGKLVLDKPGHRKHHEKAIPQIGGLIFGSLFLLITWSISLIPNWYLIGGIISITVGLIDDTKPIRWELKLFIQIALMIYIIFSFWSSIESINFYNYSLLSNRILLLCIFIFWFIGIYNAVNLIDGLDGLAAGFMVIISLASSLSINKNFNDVNFILFLLLISFLLFNQRKARIFMGDAGSLFLGFHVAVLPLLYFNELAINKELLITPFILLVSYLIADTTRVFFTRLADSKNPMSADTIHFHHLVLKKSHSYLASISSIYFITAISAIFAVLSFHFNLSQGVMLGHLGLLLLFILTPPIETYVPLIAKVVSPFYNWQKNNIFNNVFFFRTAFITVLISLIIVSSLNLRLLNQIISFENILALCLIILFISINGYSKISMYCFQIGVLLFINSATNGVELLLITKLFIVFTILSLIIFTFEKRYGTLIYKYSSLDILIIIVSLFGIICSFFIKIPILPWSFASIIAIWFGLSFIFRRIIKFKK